MRILWVKTELLHPVDKGGRIRTYQMLKAINAQHDVSYLWLDDGTATPEHRELAREYSARDVPVPFSPPAKGSARFYVDVSASLASRLPYAISRYRSAALRRAITVEGPQHELVVCDFLAPSVNFPDHLAARSVLFQHNVEAQIWARHAENARNAAARAFMALQARRMHAFESAECQRFGRVVAVSEADRDMMQARYAPSQVSAVGTGVDIEYFEPCLATPRVPKDVIFVGSMDWMPNDDGMRWFLDEVYGLLRSKEPAVQVWIVGRNPSSQLRARAAELEGVHVTGTVADIRPFLGAAAVSIVPLRIGGGTRLKIFESMAAGTPVVSTEIGAEGLEIESGRHFLRADAPEEFASAVARMLQHPEGSTGISQEALEHVRSNCSWSRVAADFVGACGGRG
jgi:glycosyltransferase involved in cell wall biosynthesis